MKKILLLSMAIVLINALAKATIRRIQYSGTPVTGVDYASGNLAVAASSAGDTIMVFLSASDNFTIDKKLVIIGPGSFNWSGSDANYNPNLQNVQAGLNRITITFAPGSDGTIITGCILDFNTSGNVAINNIKITNCFLQIGGTIGTSGNNFNFDNWEFSKCYIQNPIYNTTTSGSLTNLKLFNCILDGYSIYLGPNPAQTGVIENCSFYNVYNIDLNFNSFIIQNCIFYSSNIYNNSNSVFNNNIFDNTIPVTGTGNIFNVPNTNFFTGIPTLGTNSKDGKFKLAAGSPAIGKGIGGIDCGAFGGTNPYKLSLVPAVPAIYKLTAPTTAAATNPYQITFSVRANN